MIDFSGATKKSIVLAVRGSSVVHTFIMDPIKLTKGSLKQLFQTLLYLSHDKQFLYPRDSNSLALEVNYSKRDDLIPPVFMDNVRFLTDEEGFIEEFASPIPAQEDMLRSAVVSEFASDHLHRAYVSDPPLVIQSADLAGGLPPCEDTSPFVFYFRVESPKRPMIAYAAEKTCAYIKEEQVYAIPNQDDMLIRAVVSRVASDHLNYAHSTQEVILYGGSDGSLPPQRDYVPVAPKKRKSLFQRIKSRGTRMVSSLTKPCRQCVGRSSYSVSRSSSGSSNSSDSMNVLQVRRHHALPCVKRDAKPCSKKR